MIGCLGGLVPLDSVAAAVVSMSPLVTVGTLIATRVFQVFALSGLVIGIVTVWRPRWFCRWLCPMGLCLDTASNLGRRFGRKSLKGFKFGPWLLLLTLGGALLGYPLLLWLDPLALFSGVLRHPPAAGGLSGWSWVIVLGAIWLACVIWPNVWCGRICPLGAWQDVLTQIKGLLRSRTGKTDAGQQKASLVVVARRTIIAMGLGVVGGSLAKGAGKKGPKPLRPPGAADESCLAGLCIRCGNCAKVCPAQIITYDTDQQRLLGFLAPVLDYSADYCREDCVACGGVCPSGALTALPLDEKPAVRLGFPQVDMEICLLGDDRECSACQRWCPYGAVHYEFSEASYTLAPVIDPEKCNGCGACQAACPTRPVKAIRVYTE